MLENHPDALDQLLANLIHTNFVIKHEFALVKRGSAAANPYRARFVSARYMENLSVLLEAAKLDNYDGYFFDMCACQNQQLVAMELQSLYETMELCNLSPHKMWDHLETLPPTPMFVLYPDESD